MRRYIYVQNTKAVRLGEKPPHLPIYSAKRERTFEVGRFYTVSVPSNLQLFFENDFLQIAVLKSAAKVRKNNDICKYLCHKLYQIRKIILIILYQIPKNNMPKR